MLLPYWNHSGEVHLLESYPDSLHDWALGEEVLESHQSLHRNVKETMDRTIVRTSCKSQGMNITLDATLDDGKSVIVRQRHNRYVNSDPVSENWSLTKFENEIQLLRWLRQLENNSIPVPSILGVGSNLSIQEKMPGSTVANQWHFLISGAAKDHFIASYVSVVLELFHLPVPQKIGSAMFDKLGEIENSSITIQVGPCIGVNPSQSSAEVFDDIFTYFQFLVDLKRQYVENQEPDDRHRSGETLSFVEAKASQILQNISDNDSKSLLRCVLTHADLHNWNILVNSDGDITAVLDWEINYIEPAILSAQYPVWLSDHGPLDPRFASNDIWWEESPAERKRLCTMFEEMVRERDAEFYRCLVEGRDLRAIVSWLKDTDPDPGFERLRAWAMSELS